MTCTTPLPERLDPPDTASECAICHRVTEDGRDLDLCDEAVDALLDAGAIRRNTAVDTGVQFVCESCLDDLHDAQERHRAEAFDALSDALGLDEYEHPALRARKVVQRLHPSQPVAGGVVVPRGLLETALRALQCSDAYVGNGIDHTALSQLVDDLRADLADARQCLSMFTDAPRTEVEMMKAAPVVVPELTDEEVREAWYAVDADPEQVGDGYQLGVRHGYSLAVSRLRTVQPGEVVVPISVLRTVVEDAGMRTPEGAASWEHLDALVRARPTTEKEG